MGKLILFMVGFVLLLGQVAAQKKALDMEAYKEWRRIDAPVLSGNGKWITYRYQFMDREDQRNDTATTFLYNTTTRQTTGLGGAREVTFFGGGNWLQYTIPGAKCDTVIMQHLISGKRIPWLRNVAVSVYPGWEWVTYVYPVKSGNTKQGIFKRLVVWNVEKGDSTSIDSVGRFSFTPDGKTILYLKENGRHKSLWTCGLKGKPRKLYGIPGTSVDNYSLSPDGQGGSFTVLSDTTKGREADRLYVFSLKDKDVRLAMDTRKLALPDSLVINMRTYPLTLKSKFIILDTGPKTTGGQKAEVREKDEVQLELWRWDEEVIPCRQKHMGRKEKRSPRYIYDISSGRCMQIAAAELERLIVPETEDYGYVLALDPNPYKKMADWRDGDHADLYVVDVNTGEKRLVLRDVRETPVWSPNGKVAVLYDAGRGIWYKLNPASGELTDVSSVIGYPMYDEDNDTPKAPPAYGIAGWSADGNMVYLYDRYDIWSVPLADDRKPVSLTCGYGRSRELTLRLFSGNRDMKILDIENKLLMSSFNRESKAQGMYALLPGGRTDKLMEGDYALYMMQQADDGKSCIWTRQHYNEFRDVWYSDSRFSDPVRVTEANPRQREYKWGSVRLVDWTNFRGERNRGLLYLPEGYDSTKLYPVIVDFYERHSDGLHTYPLPSLSSAELNAVTYVSNGYVVFMPDVSFTVGAPGESCYNAVVSGTEMLIREGIADPERIGLNGHSWSGYQVAYLVTRTNLFRCASPGAAVVNMVSAYTGIREGSGRPRMFMYEQTQSRMGCTPWENMQAYIENSPITRADKIETPLLIFHCDRDEAVPYTQGVDLFLAMRRLGKPAWLLNYKGQGHFLSAKAAKVDWTTRMQQFFDYYLKGGVMPGWMKE